MILLILYNDCFESTISKNESMITMKVTSQQVVVFCLIKKHKWFPNTINCYHFFLIADKSRGTLLLTLLPNKQHAPNKALYIVNRNMIYY